MVFTWLMHKFILGFKSGRLTHRGCSESHCLLDFCILNDVASVLQIQICIQIFLVINHGQIVACRGLCMELFVCIGSLKFKHACFAFYKACTLLSVCAISHCKIVKCMKLLMHWLLAHFYCVPCACTTCTLRSTVTKIKSDWLDVSQDRLLAKGLLSKTSPRIISCALSLPILFLKALFMYTMPGPVKSEECTINYCDSIAKINISFL